MMNGRHLPAGQQGMPPDMGRRRQYNPNPNPQFQQGVPMGYGYMNPYHAAYYPPQQLPPHYHSAAVPYQYGPYPPPPPHVRSPPPMQHYAHPPIPQHHPYPRSQPSPAMAAPYQPPPPPPPPQTPPSTHSSHTVPGPMTPPTPQTTLSVPPSSPPPEVPRTPFRAPVRNLLSPSLIFLLTAHSSPGYRGQIYHGQ
jgi:ubiquitin carboxyl-terminal hydrolase 10